MKLRLTDYTYMDTDGSCELCMYTGLLDHPEFQFTDSDGGVHGRAVRKTSTKPSRGRWLMRRPETARL